MTVEEKLDAIFNDLMPDEQSPVRERTLAATASWDSMCQLSLVIALEQEFAVTFTDADAQELTSYAMAKAILADHGVRN